LGIDPPLFLGRTPGTGYPYRETFLAADLLELAQRLPYGIAVAEEETEHAHRIRLARKPT